MTSFVSRQHSANDAINEAGNKSTFFKNQREIFACLGHLVSSPPSGV
jgi:hypothetical protein